MRPRFLNHMNDLIADSYLEMSDEEITSLIQSDEVKVASAANRIKSILDDMVKNSRAKQLASVRKRFYSHENFIPQEAIASNVKSLDEMIKDIVDVLQNKSESVPNGIVIAFRNQSRISDDKSIQEIWSDLVSLGLIDSDDTGEDQ